MIVTAILLHLGFLTLGGNALPYSCAQKTNLIQLGPGDTAHLMSHQTFRDEDYPSKFSICYFEVQMKDGCHNITMDSPFFDVNGNRGKNCFAGDFVAFVSSEEAFRECGNGLESRTKFNRTITTNFRIWFFTNDEESGKGFLLNLKCPGGDQAKTCRCGKSGLSRIVGGVATKPHEYPWQVGLVEKDMSNRPICGGVILSSKWVMTAAHCLQRRQVESLEIALADHNWQTSYEATDYVNDIIRAIVHPRYNFHVKNNYDLALLEMVDAIDFEAYPTLRPVCYPTIEPSVGQKVTATGWGRLEEGGQQATVLQEVDLEIISTENCNARYNGTITQSMICAGEPLGGKDACQGDSGGPLVTRVGENYELVGIVSWGYGCARPFTPGVYASTLATQSWWQSYIGHEEACPR